MWKRKNVKKGAKNRKIRKWEKGEERKIKRKQENGVEKRGKSLYKEKHVENEERKKEK